MSLLLDYPHPFKLLPHVSLLRISDAQMQWSDYRTWQCLKKKGFLRWKEAFRKSLCAAVGKNSFWKLSVEQGQLEFNIQPGTLAPYQTCKRLR